MTTGPYMVDSYRDFLKTEGLPVYDGLHLNALELDLEDWARLGGRGAYLHLAGRSEFDTSYVAEIAPGGSLNWERHMFEELIFVMKGHGSTTVSLPGDRKTTFEWGPNSLFSIPLNMPHRHFNGSGSEAVRFVGFTNMPIMLNMFHSEAFVFDNPFVFPDRGTDESHFAGEGTFHEVRAGKHQWETNFVPDVTQFDQLRSWPARGANGTNIQLILGDSILKTHISEFPVGTYKKAHRHRAGVTIFTLDVDAYTLMWVEGESPVESIRIDWKPGVVFAPPSDHFHQMFNLSGKPIRYMAMTIGSVRYPVLEWRRKAIPVSDVSVAAGGSQIEYEDEDPRIRELFVRESARVGLSEPAMPEAASGAPTPTT